MPGRKEDILQGLCQQRRGDVHPRHRGFLPGHHVADPLPDVSLGQLCTHQRPGKVYGLARSSVHPRELRDVHLAQRQILGYCPRDLLGQQQCAEKAAATNVEQNSSLNGYLNDRI